MFEILWVVLAVGGAQGACEYSSNRDFDRCTRIGLPGTVEEQAQLWWQGEQSRFPVSLSIEAYFHRVFLGSSAEFRFVASKASLESKGRFRDSSQQREGFFINSKDWKNKQAMRLQRGAETEYRTMYYRSQVFDSLPVEDTVRISGKSLRNFEVSKVSREQESPVIRFAWMKVENGFPKVLLTCSSLPSHCFWLSQTTCLQLEASLGNGSFAKESFYDRIRVSMGSDFVSRYKEFSGSGFHSHPANWQKESSPYRLKLPFHERDVHPSVEELYVNLAHKDDMKLSPVQQVLESCAFMNRIVPSPSGP